MKRPYMTRFSMELCSRRIGAAVAYVVLASGLTVLGTPTPAVAVDYMDDGWTGTVEILANTDLGGGNSWSFHATYIVDGRHEVNDDVANGFGTWMQPKRVVATHSTVAANSCPGGGAQVYTGEIDAPEESDQGIFDVTWQDGQHHITVNSLTFFTVRSNCGGPDSQYVAENFGIAEEHPSGQSAPAELIGEKTESSGGTTRMSRWNLTRTPDPDQCLDRRFSTASGVAAYRIGAVPDPDFATHHLSMTWCLGPTGAFVVSGASFQDLSSNWFFLAALEELGFKPYALKSNAQVTRTSVRGRSIFGVTTSPLGVVLKLTPTGRLLNSAAKGLSIYKSWVKLGMKHDKARDKMDDYLRKHVRKWTDGLDTLVFEALDRVRGVSRNQALAWTVIMSKVFEDIGNALRQKLVKKLIGGKNLTKKTFKSVFRTIDVALWNVDATLTVSDSGTAGFVNRSKTRIVFDEWEHHTVT